MQPVAQRAAAAEDLWRDGDAALASGQAEQAYRYYTAAHDQVTDCPKLHLEAHRRLRRVTRQRDPRGEYLTDTLLVKLVPRGPVNATAIAATETVLAQG